MPRRSARLMKLEQQKQEKKTQMERMSGGGSYFPVTECVLVTEDPYVTELKNEIVELKNQLAKKDRVIERLETVAVSESTDFYERTLTAKNDKIVQLTRQLETVRKRLMDFESRCVTQETKIRESQRSLIAAEKREKVWQTKCYEYEIELGAKDDVLYRLEEAEDAHARAMKAIDDLLGAVKPAEKGAKVIKEEPKEDDTVSVSSKSSKKSKKDKKFRKITLPNGTKGKMVDGTFEPIVNEEPADSDSDDSDIDDSDSDSDDSYSDSDDSYSDSDDE